MHDTCMQQASYLSRLITVEKGATIFHGNTPTPIAARTGCMHGLSDLAFILSASYRYVYSIAAILAYRL